MDYTYVRDRALLDAKKGDKTTWSSTHYFLCPIVKNGWGDCKGTQLELDDIRNRKLTTLSFSSTANSDRRRPGRLPGSLRRQPEGRR